MKDLDKNRIAFTVALSASNFALYPIVKDIRAIIHLSYEPVIKLNYFFWIFNICLGISIYLYAVSFIGETTSLRRTKRVADGVFRITMVLPLLYFFYYLVGFLINYFYVHNLKDYGTGMAIMTDDYLFNFLQMLPLVFILFVVGVIVYDILDDYNKIAFRLKRHSKDVDGK